MAATVNVCLNGFLPPHCAADGCLCETPIGQQKYTYRSRVVLTSDRYHGWSPSWGPGRIGRLHRRRRNRRRRTATTAHRRGARINRAHMADRSPSRTSRAMCYGHGNDRDGSLAIATLISIVASWHRGRPRLRIGRLRSDAQAQSWAST